eukprot:130250-Prymnesium_polylepis.1
MCIRDREGAGRACERREDVEDGDDGCGSHRERRQLSQATRGIVVPATSSAGAGPLRLALTNAAIVSRF